MNARYLMLPLAELAVIAMAGAAESIITPIIPDEQTVTTTKGVVYGIE